jgi:hypothetical protein
MIAGVNVLWPLAAKSEAFAARVAPGA